MPAGAAADTDPACMSAMVDTTAGRTLHITAPVVITMAAAGITPTTNQATTIITTTTMTTTGTITIMATVTMITMVAGWPVRLSRALQLRL